MRGDQEHRARHHGDHQQRTGEGKPERLADELGAVFDRVLVSGSMATLGMLTLITVVMVAAQLLLKKKPLLMLY